MAAERPPAGRVKDHAPRDVGRATEELPVDEVAEASEAKSDGDSWRGQVGDGVEAVSFSVAKNAYRNDHADQSAMKRHAAFPHRQKFRRILDVIGKIVEQGIAQAAAQDDSDRGIEDEI